MAVITPSFNVREDKAAMKFGGRFVYVMFESV